MSETKHTPLPWSVGVEDNQTCQIPIECRVGDDEDIVAEVSNYDGSHPGEQGEANAEFIVRACNSHDELLAVLIDLVQAHDVRMGPGAVQLRVDMARAAIARATQPATTEAKGA